MSTDTMEAPSNGQTVKDAETIAVPHTDFTVDLNDPNDIALTLDKVDAIQKEIDEAATAMQKSLIEAIGERPEDGNTKHVDLDDVRVTFRYRDYPKLDQDLTRKAIKFLPKDTRTEFLKGSIKPRNFRDLQEYLKKTPEDPKEAKGKELLAQALTISEGKPGIKIKLHSE